MTILKGSVDGLSYFSLISVILFSNRIISDTVVDLFCQNEFLRAISHHDFSYSYVEVYSCNRLNFSHIY